MARPHCRSTRIPRSKRLQRIDSNRVCSRRLAVYPRSWCALFDSKIDSVRQSCPSTPSRCWHIKRLGRPRAFTEKEEGIIIKLLCKFSDRGLPLQRRYMAEACGMLASTFGPERRASLPFNGTPGKKLLASFLKRHKATLQFALPNKQERKRFKAVCPEVLTTHFAHLERLILKHNLDASRIWNLDESGGTPRS
eukprot:IDg1872t1